MKSKFFRLATLFCAVLLMVSCLLVLPSPVGAKAMNDDSSGGGSVSESSSDGSSSDGGSLGEHMDRVSKDIGIGSTAAGIGALVIGQPEAAVPAAIAGATGKVIDGCLGGCHTSRSGGGKNGGGEN